MSDDTAAIIRRTLRLVEAASANHISAMTCLRRSLTSQWLLARRGVPTELRFGVNKEAGELNAHAWLEHAGIPIGEPEAITERFAQLY